MQAYGEQPGTMSVANVADHEHPDDIVAQVVRVPVLLDDGNAEALWDEVPRDERYSWTADEGVQASEVAVGVGMVVALAAVVAGAVVWRSRRRRRPSRFTFPTTVLHTIRAAEDRRLRQQADAEVLALGEAIGSGEPGGTAHALDAWQQALDHYSAARGSCPRSPAPPMSSAPSSSPDAARTPALPRRSRSRRRGRRRCGAGSTRCTTVGPPRSPGGTTTAGSTYPPAVSVPPR